MLNNFWGIFMDFRDLSYVLAIARYQNITKAANSLYVTQPTLTKFLQNLEAELGQKLFRKLGHRFVLTYAGERYVEKAAEILNLKKELMGPVLKTIVLRLIIMAGLLVLANMIIFHLFPFDRELEIALMVLYALPAPFIIPIFSDVGKDGEYVSTSLSAHTLVTVILYAMIVVYGMSVL